MQRDVGVDILPWLVYERNIKGKSRVQGDDRNVQAGRSSSAKRVQQMQVKSCIIDLMQVDGDAMGHR
jgi:hypothetical protein